MMLDTKIENKTDERELIVREIIENINKHPDQVGKFMSEFYDIYSDDIYSFPIRFYNFSEDEAGDFYLYAFEHLRNGKRLSAFQGKSKFSTWFFSVLRHLTIDFLRVKKESVRSISYLKMNSDGQLVNMIEEFPDDRQFPIWEEDISSQFSKSLDQLKMDQKILFKMAYIHFFNLIPEEVQWVARQNNVTNELVISKIVLLKEIALKKVNQVKPFESKLNVSFDKIITIERCLFQFFYENPDLPKEESLWSEDYQNSKLPVEVVQKIQELARRRIKHRNLLLKQKKSFLSVRVPYKELSEMLNSTEGVLSVQLLRIIDKLGKIMQKK